jgi:hypothetical protein
MECSGRKTVFLWLGLLGMALGANTRSIETPFTLSSDARSEFSAGFQVFSAGRILIEGVWNGQQGGAYTLHISLVRPDGSEAARRTSKSPLRIEQQITSADIERGKRIVVRLQNDGAARVKGRVKVTFAPAF